MKRILLWTKRYLPILGVVSISVIAWLITYFSGLSVIYNDAMSHLNISRLIIDNLQPGFSQLGGVWLPLNHMLDLLLIWNNWAWHSGFAGSIFSMISFVISVWGMYAIIKMSIRKKFIAFIGAGVFALNVNMLYLQSTPLTEPLFLVFFILSTYCLIAWLQQDKPNFLLFLGLCGFCQVLIRYDGWFVVFIEMLLIIFYEIYLRRHTLLQIFGLLLFFIMPVLFGMGIWILWNMVIFKNPLYFILGPYSAHSQQTLILVNSGLATKGNIGMSLLAYGSAVIDTIGIPILLFSCIGMILFFFKKNIEFYYTQRILIALMLLSPIIFNIIALVLGFTSLDTPQLHLYTTPLVTQWFNVRYAILALPAVSFFAAMLVPQTSRFLFETVTIAWVIIFAQGIYFIHTGVTTVIDGQTGSSSFTNSDIANFLKQKVGPSDTILMSTSYFNPVAFQSGIRLNQLIHEGVSALWKKAIYDPAPYATWIVMPNGDIGDSVYTALMDKEKKGFLQYYKLAFSGKHANVYEKKGSNDLFIIRERSTLKVNDAAFTIHGVNAYDLAYQTNSQIEYTFSQLSKSNVNVVRFWLFGEGTTDGFQPLPGIMNENRFLQADEIITTAKKYHIRLIPVLVNNWTDYGGKNQYVSWVGKDPLSNPDLFYTNPDTQNLMKNYINKVVNRINTYTHIPYAKDSTILAWDLMNEPQPDTSVYTWTEQMTSYLKQLDQNHLVTIGTQDISMNQIDLCAIPSIDICSIHTYLNAPDDITVYSSAEIGQKLKNEVVRVKNDQKPIFIEELGISKQSQIEGSSPLTYLKSIITKTKTMGYTGELIWNWSVNPDNSFGFSPVGFHGEFTQNDLKKLLA